MKVWLRGTVLEFCLFVDDICNYFEPDNIVKLILKNIVNRKLQEVKKWLEANKLALDKNKTDYGMFHSTAAKIDEFIRVKIDFWIMNQVNYVKYSGLCNLPLFHYCNFLLIFSCE